MKLADLTTLRIGGPIAELVEAWDEEQLVDAVRRADRDRRPLLVLGGGSNLVASDAPFEGTVVQVRDDGAAPQLDEGCELPSPQDPGAGLAASCGGIVLTHFAGASWDRAVDWAVAHELRGTEALSGIPGSVGATPIQNVGAYGQDVSQTLRRVRTWDRQDEQLRTFAPADCAFGYRDSLFKRTPFTRAGFPASATGRFVVLSVSFQHTQGSLSAPVRYAELARQLGVEAGQRTDLTAVREKVLAIRASKGMVLDAADHDTWSAGSFFTNPILGPEAAASLPEEAPRFDAGQERVKTSAAWLISHAGLERGFAVGPRASLSTKHSLALTNRGGATSEDIVELARAVQDRVKQAFGIHLEPEPVRLGVDL